jgi:DNA-binding NarL/FixJ family response regulator
MRVLIVDDHPIFRSGLRRVLEGSGVEVVGEAGSGAEAIDLVGSLSPDVVLMDLALPGMSGIEATRAIRSSLSATKIVVLTAALDDREIFAAIEAGAEGYLLKDIDAGDLVNRLQRVLEGEPALTPAVARRLWSRYKRPTRSKRPDPGVLTDREIEVLALMFGGVTANRDLAKHLVVTENTVRYHLNNIFHKLQVRDKVQAVAQAVRRGILHPPQSPDPPPDPDIGPAHFSKPRSGAGRIPMAGVA